MTASCGCGGGSAWPPCRTLGFRFSTDPPLEAKVTDVVSLYLENAVAVCADEKSQCQALERTQPIRPMRLGIRERHQGRR
jgi:hypothetical protein